MRNKTFGEYMKRMRHYAGLSQERAAELIGVTAHTIQNWEYDDHVPNSCYYDKIIEAYHLNRNEFFYKLGVTSNVSYHIMIKPLLDEIYTYEPRNVYAFCRFMMTQLTRYKHNESNSQQLDTFSSATRKPRINANEVGINVLRTAVEVYNNYKKQKNQESLEDRICKTYANIIGKDDEISVRDLKIDARERLLKGLQSNCLTIHGSKIVSEPKCKAAMLDDFF